MGNWFTYEFQLKHFKYHDCTSERFYTSQWGENIWIFCAYKCFFFLYWLGWIVAAIVIYENKTSYLFYLTNWQVWTIMLYFGMSFGVCVHRIVTRKSCKDDAGEATPAAIEERDSPVVSASRLKWFHKLNWILHSVAFDIALLVTITFWTLIPRPSTPAADDPLSLALNNHALTTGVMLVDLFVNNIPERLLHVVHSFAFVIIYTTYSVILHVSGTASNVYAVINWSNSPGLAAGISIGAAFATIFLRCIAFGLFKLRSCIAAKTTRDRNGGTRQLQSNPGDEENLQNLRLIKQEDTSLV